MPLKDGLEDYYKQSTRQIEDIVELVRGKLSTMSRITLGALIVIDVHGELAWQLVDRRDKGHSITSLKCRNCTCE